MRSGRSKKSSGKPASETVRVNITSRETGKTTRTTIWPLSFWRALERRASSLGVTVDQHVNSLLAGDLEETRDSIVLSPRNLARAQEIADILEMSLAAYIDRVLDGYLADIHKWGKIFEIEVDCFGTFPSRAAARRISRKALAFDAECDIRRAGHASKMPAIEIGEWEDGGWYAAWRKEK